MAATLPAAICERLQLLPTYFDATPNWLHEMCFYRLLQYQGIWMESTPINPP